MPSQLRSDTARANGAKSRGPKSAETWEKSSRNSLRHLFTSRHTILLECENEDEFQELEDDFAASLTYTGTGKRTLISGARTFTYDFENRVKSMNGGAVTLQYDGHGNRTVKTVNGVTTRYLVNDLNPTGYPQVVGEIVGSA